jgi:hypothetical protein
MVGVDADCEPEAARGAVVVVLGTDVVVLTPAPLTGTVVVEATVVVVPTVVVVAGVTTANDTAEEDADAYTPVAATATARVQVPADTNCTAPVDGSTVQTPGVDEE